MNRDLRRAGNNPNSRPIVRLDEMETVLDGWLSGTPIETIFAALPRNQRSTRKPALNAWIRGVPDDSTWNDQFATFFDYVNNCLIFFLPWVLRAARNLAELDGHPVRPWNDWARFLELGVDTVAASDLLDDNISFDRETARALGLRLEGLSGELIDRTHRATQIFEELVGDRSPDLGRFLGWYIRRENGLRASS